MQHMVPNKFPKFPLPHPIEWIVALRLQPTHYEKVAQFRYKHHAVAFAESVGCFHYMIIEPAIGGVVR